MHYRIKLFCTFISLFALLSCSKSYDLGGEAQLEIPVDANNPTWENGIRDLVSAKCTTCHTNSRGPFVPPGTPAYLNQIGSKAWFDSLYGIEKFRIINSPGSQMPPQFATQLTSNESLALSNYFASLVANPTARQARFNTFYNFISTRCASCHTGPHPAGTLEFVGPSWDSEAEWYANGPARGYIVLNDSFNSLLYTKIKGNDGFDSASAWMPLNYTPTAAEVLAVKDFINQIAP